MMKWSTAKPFALLGGIVAAIAVGMVSYLIETRPETAQRRAAAATQSDYTGGSRTRVVTVTPLPAVVEKSEATPPANANPGESAQWDEKIQTLLADQSISVREASRHLLAMAADAGGPESKRVDSMRHGLTLLDDADYAEFALPLAVQTGLSKEMQEVLIADLYNRPPAVSVPVADAIAAVPGHPLADQARELSEFFKSAAAAGAN